MNKNEVATSSAHKDHEGAALAQMRAAIRAIETAIHDASHGGYREAAKVAQNARDRLYFTEIELRKAEICPR